MSKEHCYDCAYRRNIPGNCHIECARGFKNIKQPELNAHGRKNGWCYWPLNFDPIWVGKCEGFSKEEKKEDLRGETDPLVKILSLLI